MHDVVWCAHQKNRKNLMAHQPILLIIGTRPEGIKMIPLYLELKKASLPVVLVSTGQHTDLLHDVFSSFNVTPDIDLALGKPNQDLSYLTQAVLVACATLYEKIQPALVAVEGDTTTVMAAGLAAFYKNIPILHVEAGLRTDDIRQPYPEEMNRRVLGLIADYHCAPTALAAANLLAEGIAQTKIFCTGNTVVDALRMMQEKIQTQQVEISAAVQARIEQEKALGKKIVLLTAHRRESFNGGITAIFNAVKKIMKQHKDIFFIYPVHPNPNIRRAIDETCLENNENLLMVPAFPYQDLVYVLTNAALVMTDSGGIQEEAVSLGKPTIVLREKTERSEGVWEGLAYLVGTDEEKIQNVFERILVQGTQHHATNVYGDGYAARRIVNIIKNSLPADAVTMHETVMTKMTNDEVTAQAQKTTQALNISHQCETQKSL
jgi:UDP-N-acetylglucosamine 2-epimerase (non-hydrolysing)